jgi:hypothetical protein
MSAQLEKKIVTALTAEPPPPLDRLLTLISEVESGIIAAESAAELAREQFLDPIATPDANAGRAKLESKQFISARLRTLLPKLQERAHAVQAEENRKDWQVDFARCAEERNQLAAELRETYPKVVSQLVSLFSRIRANDLALSDLHGSRPDGAKGTLLSAELTARNLSEFNRDQPSLTRDLRLPEWQESCRLAWPPRDTPAAVLLSESIASQGDPRRHSSEWYQVLREDNARRVAEEQKRIEQEQRHTAEERAVYERSLPR